MAAPEVYRHMPYIDSPPDHFVAEPLILEVRLPNDWDGDAWVDPADRDNYCLRAWSKKHNRWVIVFGRTFAVTFKELRAEIEKGGRIAQ